MKITFKDYATNETVLTVPLELIYICGSAVYVCNISNETFNDEIEQAVYAVNHDVHSGVLADNYSESYAPINPYMIWSFDAQQSKIPEHRLNNRER